MRFARLAAVGGIAGPAAFTAAWVVGSLLQTGHSAVEVQISGLAADDARYPGIMMAGFFALGVGTIAFGAGLRRVPAAGAAGPWLVMAGGAASVVAGAFRRDQMLLIGPGFFGESWHNQVHDVASDVAYGALLLAPLVLGQGFRRDPGWAVLSRPVQVLTLTGAVALAVFGSRAVPAYDGTLQRIAVTFPLTAAALMAARMLRIRPEAAVTPGYEAVRRS